MKEVTKEITRFRLPTLRVVQEPGQTYSSCAGYRTGSPIRNSQDIYDIACARYQGLGGLPIQEEFLVVGLNQKHVPKWVEIASRGTLTSSLVHPREAFSLAVADRCASVAFVHNHPSGDPSPSRDDQGITYRLLKAGELLGIRVVDHVIVGDGRHYSFADQGKLTCDCHGI